MINKKKTANIFLLSGLVLLLGLFCFCLGVIPASAQDNSANVPETNRAEVPNKAPAELQNPLGETDPVALISRVIFAVLGLTGAIALVMFIWGGLQWMTAAGNAEKVTKGRDTLMWAALGLIIIFSSYAVLTAVFKALQG